jgi:hypothetical protein
MATIGRRAYAEIFGPTVGDRVRLADTGLLIEVEKDYTLASGKPMVKRSSSAAARPSATAWRSPNVQGPKVLWTA